MHTFDDNKIPDELLTPEILQLLASIHEHKGRQDLFLSLNTVVHFTFSLLIFFGMLPDKVYNPID